MTRDEFMVKARGEARQILQGKENGIMNLVQRAWAEGKRNAEVETLRAAIDEALDRREPKAEPHEDAVYPTYETWLEFIKRFETGGPKSDVDFIFWMGTTPIPADIAEKLGVEPKEDI